MFSNVQGKWTLVTLLLTASLADFQMPMPMYPCPMPGCAPMMAMPPPPIPVPVPVAVPVGIPIPVAIKTTTTTTTTTEAPGGGSSNGNDHNSIAIAFPIHVPMPVQFAIPAMPQPDFCQKKPKDTKCPPCPPCSCSPCTPSFFSYCSPCHQVCRCKKSEDAPSPMPPVPPQQLPGPAFPMPIPIQMSGPVIMVPYPPSHHPGPSKGASSCSSSEVSESSSGCSEGSDSSESRKKRRRPGLNKKRYDIYRRRYRTRRKDRSDNELVKPMLSYVAENGDIKINRQISQAEADELMDVTSFQVVAEEDSSSRLVVLSRGTPNVPGKRTRKQIAMRQGLGQHVMSKNGRKKLIFKPPPNKKISNLSVSFQVVK